MPVPSAANGVLTKEAGVWPSAPTKGAVTFDTACSACSIRSGVTPAARIESGDDHQRSGSPAGAICATTRWVSGVTFTVSLAPSAGSDVASDVSVRPSSVSTRKSTGAVNPLAERLKRPPSSATAEAVRPAASTAFTCAPASAAPAAAVPTIVPGATGAGAAAAGGAVPASSPPPPQAATKPSSAPTAICRVDRRAAAPTAARSSGTSNLRMTLSLSKAPDRRGRMLRGEGTARIHHREHGCHSKEGRCIVRAVERRKRPCRLDDRRVGTRKSLQRRAWTIFHPLPDGSRKLASTLP